MKKITLKDIAKELNISTTTVSKALKDYPDISQQTKDRVLKLAEEWNFTPNVSAQNLRSQSSHLIGIILPDLVHHFFSRILSGAIEEATQKGYMIIALQSNELLDNEITQVNLLKQFGVDGVIISLSNETEKPMHIQQLIDNDISVVLIDKVSKEINCSRVVIDDYKAAYDATSFLIQKGRKKIAHLGGPIIPKNAKDRLRGYRDALIHHDLFFDTELIIRTTHSDFESGKDATQKLLKKNPDIDGFFCATDMLAVGCISEAKKQGFSIPNDISVVGFSNWHMTELVTPTLTTIDQPGEDMGREAVDLLVKEIENKDTDVVYKKVVLDTTLIEREST